MGNCALLPTKSALLHHKECFIERIKHSLRCNKALFVVDEAVGRLRVYFMKFKVHFPFDLAHVKFYNNKQLSHAPLTTTLDIVYWYRVHNHNHLMLYTDM